MFSWTTSSKSLGLFQVIWAKMLNEWRTKSVKLPLCRCLSFFFWRGLLGCGRQEWVRSRSKIHVPYIALYGRWMAYGRSPTRPFIICQFICPNKNQIVLARLQIKLNGESIWIRLSWLVTSFVFMSSTRLHIPSHIFSAPDCILLVQHRLQKIAVLNCRITVIFEC